MLNMSNVVSDADLVAPQSFVVRRSQGAWTTGGFANTTSDIGMSGPVQQASDKELQMLPTADNTTGVLSFWSTQPIYETRNDSVSSTQSLVLTGGPTTYTVAPALTGGVSLYKNGLLLQPELDYTLSGQTITLVQPAQPNDVMAATSSLPVQVPAVSDLLIYGGSSYRVMRVYHDPGCGYWKAYATQMEGA